MSAGKRVPLMAVLVLGVLILCLVGGSSGAPWCVCKTGISDPVLQKAIDYACGYGADCNPINPNGLCYNPNSVKSHCDYAVNSYFQRKNQAQGSCDFSGTAAITTTDPSTNGCSYPSSGGQVVNNPASPTTPVFNTPPVTNVPSTNSPFTNTPPSNTPFTNTPPSNTPFTNTPPSNFNPTTPPGGGIVGGGGFNPGLGPSGIDSNIGFLARASTSFLSLVLLFSSTMLFRA